MLLGSAFLVFCAKTIMAYGFFLHILLLLFAVVYFCCVFRCYCVLSVFGPILQFPICFVFCATVRKNNNKAVNWQKIDGAVSFQCNTRGNIIARIEDVARLYVEYHHIIDWSIEYLSQFSIEVTYLSLIGH